jgi:rare lipoprotein A (peptidoglycan hydrolase)
VGSSGKHRPRSRFRIVLFVAGLAVVALAAGALALMTGGGSAEPVRALRSAPPPTVPLADPPRATPTRASRDKARSKRPVARPTKTTAKPRRATTVRPKPRPTPKKTSNYRVTGSGSCQASYYWEGQLTASGERFVPDGLTAAHKTLPLGSRVRVTNTGNDRSVVVRINDRGPFVSGRCLDLSRGAMRAVGGTGSGVISVRYQVLARA